MANYFVSVEFTSIDENSRFLVIAPIRANLEHEQVLALERLANDLGGNVVDVGCIGNIVNESIKKSLFVRMQETEERNEIENDQTTVFFCLRISCQFGY